MDVSALVVAFWLCIALAGLTKGPPALVGVIAALVTARVLGGSWRAFGLLRPVAGLTSCAALIGLWVWGVWMLEPTHLWEGLWYNEIVGRVSGLGPEGSQAGPGAIVTDLPHCVLYYLVRFAPWSLGAIAAAWVLARRAWLRRTTPQGQARRLPPREAWMISAAIFALVTVIIFTFSAGKRADYIAIAFPSSALLAAWWLRRAPPRLAVRAPWLAPLTAAAILVLMVWLNEHDAAAPVPRFGDAIVRFARDVNARVAADPLPVGYWSTDDNHLQALLGSSQPAGNEAVLELLRRGQPAWILAGRRQNQPRTLEDWLGQRRRAWRAELVVQTPRMPRSDHWPEQISLYRVTPVDRR